jgi:hypothetical protein
LTTTKRNIRRPQQFEESKVEGYFMISKRDALIAVSNKLTGSQSRLWIYLMAIDSFADYTQGGEIKYHDLPPIADIAVAIGSSLDTVDKDLRKLRKLGLYDYRTVTVQGHNLTAAKAKAEAERLSKTRSESSPKFSQGKDSAYLSGGSAYLSGDSAYLSGGSAYLSGDSAYLSPPKTSEPLQNNDFSEPSNYTNYSEFIQTLSESQRANFLNFCEELTKNLSQPINDIEAWLAHNNKAGKNRWEVYYQKFLAKQKTQINKSKNNQSSQHIAKKFQQEIEEQRQQAMLALQGEV